jgi:hypothetical protein
LRKTRSRLKQADAALAVRPDKLVAAVARLVAARGALAEGRARMAARMAAGARCGWPVPPWLRQKLSLVEFRSICRKLEATNRRDAVRRARQLELI